MSFDKDADPSKENMSDLLLSKIIIKIQITNLKFPVSNGLNAHIQALKPVG